MRFLKNKKRTIEVWFWHGAVKLNRALVLEILASELHKLELMYEGPERDQNVLGIRYYGTVDDFINALPNRPVMKLSDPDIIYTTQFRNFSQR